MPLLVTLADLRPLVRSQAATQRIRFVDDTDLNPWIVEEWTRLYDLFSLSGDPYFEKEKTVTLLNDGTLTIPSDLLYLRRVDFMNGTQPEELPDLDVHEVAALQNANPIPGRAAGFRLRSSEIQLPQAVTGQSYKVTYCPAPVEPRNTDGTYNDTLTMDVVSVPGRRLLVLESAIHCYQKQKEDFSALAAEAAVLRSQLSMKANKRTITRLKRVAQVVTFDDPWLSRRRSPRYYGP